MTARKIITFLILSLCLAAGPALGNEDGGRVLPLDIATAIDMAFEASEDLRIEENEVLRLESKRREERADLLPQVSGTATWSNNFRYPDIPSTAYKKEYDLDAGLTVNQTVFTFGRVSSAVAAAQRAIEAGRLNKQGAEQALIYNTKLAYYSAYLAKRTLEIAEQSYENAVQNKKILEERSASGRVSKYDNIKIAADIASRMPVVNNARAEFVSAIETLKVAVGVEANTTIEFAEGFPETYPALDRDVLARSLYENQPAIKALAKTIDETAALVRSKKAEYFPEVSAFATWNHKGSGDDYDVGADNLDDYGVAGLKVSVPIWTGGETTEELQQARIDQRNAKLQYEKGHEDYLLELDKAISEYREFVKTLAANEEAIRWARESFELSQELFGSGQISVTDLNDAGLQLTNAEMNKEMTLFNLNITLARIERLTLMGKDDG